MPPETHSLEDNPLFVLLERYAKQWRGAAPGIRPFSGAHPDKSFSNSVKAVSMLKKTLSLPSGLSRVR